MDIIERERSIYGLIYSHAQATGRQRWAPSHHHVEMVQMTFFWGGANDILLPTLLVIGGLNLLDHIDQYF